MDFELGRVAPKPMPRYQEVLGAVSDSVGGREVKGSLVVFEGSSSDRSADGVGDIKGKDQLNKEAFDRQQGFQGKTEAGVFGFQGAAGDRVLQNGLPEEGAFGEEDDIAGAGFHGVGIGIRFLAVQSGKVGIDIHVEIKSSSWFEDHSTVASAFQIPDNTLDGGGMALLGIGAETASLGHGKLDVAASVSGEVQHHSNDRRVGPRFIHGSSLWIATQGFGRRRQAVGVAVLHLGRFQNLVNQPGLRQLKISIGAFLDLDSEKF